MTQDPREELQRIMIEAEKYKKQHETITSQASLLEEAYLEMGSTIDGIENISKAKEGDELLVPLGSGSYVRAGLSDAKKLILGVGAGISIEESFDKAIETLKMRREKISAERNKMMKLADEFADKRNQLNSRYETLVREMQQATPR